MERTPQKGYSSKSRPLRKGDFFFQQSKAISRTGISAVFMFSLSVVGWLLFPAMVYVRNHPELKAKVIRLISRFPKLDARLRAFRRTNRPNITLFERFKSFLKKIIRRGITAIESSPGLKQCIISGAYRLGWYPALHRLYSRLATQGMSTLVVTGEGMTPWTRHMAARLGAARIGMKPEVQ